MMNVEILREAGIDYDGGVARFFDDRELYESVLCAFLEDVLLERIRAARAAHDLEALFSCAHELKGASGNVNMTELYRASCEAVDLLRGKKSVPEAELNQRMDALERAYLRAREGISRAQG